MDVTEARSGRGYEAAKRALDLLIAVPGIVVTSPFLLGTALAIKLESRGRVIFRQERVGRHGRSFQILKFRTMVDGAHLLGPGYLVSRDDPRITRVGAFLRRWSLDELPQLFNILRGEMSVVGPRPTLRYQVDQYTDFQRRRLEVLPGVTGWAQIRGRNGLTWPERIELDVWYVDHRSFALDCRILLKTLAVISRPDEIYNDNRADWGERDDDRSQAQAQERGSAAVPAPVSGSEPQARVPGSAAGPARVSGSEPQARVPGSAAGPSRVSGSEPQTRAAGSQDRSVIDRSI